jgi:probable F420-dependent oxidoreductase
MKIGCNFPTSEIGDDPAVIKDFAQTAEDLGYDHIVFYDHILGAVHAEDRDPPLIGPYDENDPNHEVFVLMAFLASVTTRIELTTGILVLPQRQTALVAKQTAELDILSAGRVRLGIGTGWNFVEFESQGEDFASRGRRIDEQVEVLRRLWREPIVDFRGDYHRIDRAGILPRPKREIPIWFGGYSAPAVRRAARIGEGFITGTSPTSSKGLVESLRSHAAEIGREPGELGAEAFIDFAEGPDHWCSELELWRELGGSHLSFRAQDTGQAFLNGKLAGLKEPHEHIDALETFIRAIS